MNKNFETKNQNIIPFNGMWNFRAKDTQAFFSEQLSAPDDIWSDSNKVEKFKKDTFQYYETIIELFYKKLNNIHNINLEKRFWNLLIGPWLFKFIEFYYDKFLITKNQNYHNLESLKKCKFFFLDKFDDFYSNSQNQNYNQFIFYQIYIFLTNQNIDNYYSNEENQNIRREILYSKKSLSNKVRNLLIKFNSIDKLGHNFINFNLDLSSKELIKLSHKKRNLFESFYQKFPELKVYNDNLFLNIRSTKLDPSFKSNNQFLNLLNDTLLMNVPKAYIENFRFFYDFYKKFVPEKFDKKILLRSVSETSEKTRYLISILSKSGSTIYGFQEGGIGKNIQQTEYIRYSKKFCDDFFVWSQRDDQGSRSFYCTKTFWKKDYKIVKNDILIVLGSVKPFFFSLYESNFAKFGFYQTKQVTKILEKFKSEGRINEITLRLHNQNGFEEEMYYKSNFPKLKIETRETNPYFYHLLNKSKIKIFTSDYTANMQSLVINHPTIFLWDDKVIKENPKFTSIYQNLKKNKILFNSEDDCLSHIFEIEKDIYSWWNSRDVQQAKNEYLENFCRFTDNLVNHFRDKILNEKNFK